MPQTDSFALRNAETLNNTDKKSKNLLFSNGTGITLPMYILILIYQILYLKAPLILRAVRMRK